jgi:hypothetical protein
VEGTIDVAQQIVKIGTDVYRAIPPEAFALGGFPLHGLLKHEFEDELILLGQIAGEVAIYSGLSFPALGPVAASLAIVAENAIPVYVTVGSVIGKLHHRPLNDQELAMAHYVFRQSLGDTDRIILTNLGGDDGSAFVYPSTLGPVLVNLGRRYVHNGTVPDGPALFHELTHVWQAERRGLREVFLYDAIPPALRQHYEFTPPTPTADRQWSTYGTEQQAGIVEAWTVGATLRRPDLTLNVRSRRKFAIGSPLFRYINGNIRRSDDRATTGSGRSVRQLLVDGGHRSMKEMHSEPPPIWWT